MITMMMKPLIMKTMENNTSAVMPALKELRKPLPLKWRVKSSTQYGATCIPYIDARDQMEVLDEVCGPKNWSDEYLMVGDRLICKLSIFIGGVWISKSDVGSDSNVEKEKGGVSDAFKRAGVKWGINRQAYEIEPVTLKTKEYKSKFYPIDESGKFIKGNDLTNYCNKISNL
jgi:hypothetical protein